MQTTVLELNSALEASCCNATLDNLQQNPSSIRYAYACAIGGYQSRVIDRNNFSEIYQGLKQSQSFQFCSMIPNSVFGRAARVTFPIMDEEYPIGYLWLINLEDRVLSEWEMRLVQQVAWQCAIAIRQARLYQIAQARITELEQLNRSKDDFISIVAHELRSPMTSIRLSVQTLQSILLRARTFCGEAANCNQRCTQSVNYLQILDNESEREINLLNNLLDLQRLESGYQSQEFTPIQLEDWIEEVVEPFQRRTLSRQQILKIDIEPYLPSLVSDPILVRRILNELLNNACKYTPLGETITLKVSSKSSRLRLRICNSGVEIPASELPRIFQKFYRVPDGDPWKQGGTGLGLAVVKKQVEHLGGSIQVKSAAKETCFTVELPLNTQFEGRVYQHLEKPRFEWRPPNFREVIKYEKDLIG
ncbi:MAG TPA: hypothetical protein DCP31_29675 [Cyanobacteria bacterium UBA8543]|nr:hypothetical protein [Cyanobacteria bacterium UBA8543]